jgi:hypothetical protein
MNENEVRPDVDPLVENENDSEEDEEDDEEAADEGDPGDYDDDDEDDNDIARHCRLSLRIWEICERFFDVDMEHPLRLNQTECSTRCSLKDIVPRKETTTIFSSLWKSSTLWMTISFLFRLASER